MLLRNLRKAPLLPPKLSQASTCFHQVHGWTTRRHAHHATVDLPVWYAIEAFAELRATLAAGLLPAIGAAYRLPARTLALKEAFVVRYTAGGRAALGLHRDGTLLSCNVLLNRPAEYGMQPAWFGGRRAPPLPLLGR